MGKEITEAQKRALILMQGIESLCIASGLNMTIYEGKIGFVDNVEKKIVFLWEPNYNLGGKDV